ncbi:MAG: GDSL-type esterase/lipase family protein [Pseudomonadota bacterium]
MVALGASNTWGKGVARGQAYPAHLRRLLAARGIHVRVRNAGINGNTTAQMRSRLARVITADTRVVLLQPGGNDRRRGTPQHVRRANVRAIKRRLRARGIAVVMVRNRLIRRVARSFPRPDGQRFLGPGYRAMAARLLPRVVRALRR